MGLTLVEKILLKATPSGKLEDFIYPEVDFCFGNDITAPIAVQEFLKAGFKTVAHPSRIGFICDHFTPARDMKTANNVVALRDFARRFKIKHFYDIHHCGIEHAFLIEQGLIRPGRVTIGADSHTCTGGAIGAAAFGVGSTDLAAAMKEGRLWLKVPQTINFIYKGKLGKWLSGKDLILYTIGKIGVDGALYQAMEFSGPVIRRLDLEGRLTMCNMAIEAGAKTGIIEADSKTFNYLKKVQGKKFRFNKSMQISADRDAQYSDRVEIDVTGLEPQVACPHLPSNTKAVSKLRGVKLDQVVIGSCTNGRISDLRVAAKTLRGKKVKKGLRVIILPATPAVYQQAESAGLLKVFAQAGCMVSPATCGPCLGGHCGVLDKGEVALATTNRNFIGRMGSPQSRVYLSSPAVAAASAIKGRLTHPEEIA